jgi:hypothetical protein
MSGYIDTSRSNLNGPNLIRRFSVRVPGGPPESHQHYRPGGGPSGVACSNQQARHEPPSSAPCGQGSLLRHCRASRTSLGTCVSNTSQRLSTGRRGHLRAHVWAGPGLGPERDAPGPVHADPSRPEYRADRAQAARDDGGARSCTSRGSRDPSPSECAYVSVGPTDTRVGAFLSSGSSAKQQCQPQKPHAVNDCVASILPFTSTARKRMLLPAARTNGPT